MNASAFGFSLRGVEGSTRSVCWAARSSAILGIVGSFLSCTLTARTAASAASSCS